MNLDYIGYIKDRLGNMYDNISGDCKPVRDIIMCLHLGDCKECAYDTDTNHHPNNTDCSRYKPIIRIELRVFSREEIKSIENKVEQIVLC